MSTKTYLAAAAIVLLAASCAKSAGQDKGKSASSTPDSQATSTQQSFKDLLTSGTPQKCTATFDSAKNSHSTGTIYVTKAKMRGDFSTEVQGKTYQSHMIVKDQTVYTWVEGMGSTYAFKTSLNTSAKNTDQTRSVDINQRANVSCQAWSEDDSVFTLPSGVTFAQTAAITPNGAAGKSTGQGGKSTTSPSSAACAACDQAGPNKNQCRAALGCQ